MSDLARPCVRSAIGLAATVLIGLIPVCAMSEERFFTQPTTDTQAPTQPGFTAIDTAGSPEGYVLEGILGLSRRIEIGLDYVNTPNHQLAVVGRIRFFDERQFTPAFAVGVDNSAISSFGLPAGPSPDYVYVNALKTIGRVRIMAGAYHFSSDYAQASTARNNVGALAAAELNVGSAARLLPGASSAGPPAFNLEADFAGGDNPFGQFGVGVGFHPNNHLNVQPGFVIPTDRRYGQAHFQLQVHVN